MSRRGAGAQAAERYVLRLYVADATTRSTRAIDATRAICRAHLGGGYRLKVIDIYREPKLARRDQILAVPTLVKTAPAPARTVIGDLCDGARVLAALQIPAGRSS